MFLQTDKQITVFHDGKVVVSSPVNLTKIIIPFFCPVCGYPMRTADDSASYREFSCCSMCELFWLRTKETINKESEEWKEYMERRHRSSLPQITFK